MSVLVTICARGGSKGIPGKNIKPINGKPLIAYTIECAKLFANRHNADIGLSTDSPEIKNVAAEYGLLTEYFRPAKLATDTAGKIDVIKDLLQNCEERTNKKYQYILDLDITSPLRTQEDLEQAFNNLVAHEEAQNIFSVNPSNRNPYFNMVELQSSGYVELVKARGTVISRQLAPKVYDMNASFYFYRRMFFEKGNKTSVTSKSLAFVMNHVCFDLDEPIDFTIMELLIRNNLFNFKF